MGSMLEGVADHWQLALDRAADVLDACSRVLPPDDLRERRSRLALERTAVARDLAGLAGAHARPWLAPWPLHPAQFGLRNDVGACVFDLDGVLTDSNLLHAAAWAEVLDGFLVQRSELLVPFDACADYRAYFEGRPRLEGLELFLQGRGVHVSSAIARELAAAKSDAVGRRLRRRGVNALPMARLYLEAAGHAGVHRAVVSSSTRTLPMLELAGLDGLIDARVDAEQIADGRLRSRPAPDVLLRATEVLGADPASAVAFVHTADGVVAGRAAGMTVVGVAGMPSERERLLAFGADRVVGRLGDLLEPRLVALAA